VEQTKAKEPPRCAEEGIGKDRARRFVQISRENSDRAGNGNSETVMNKRNEEQGEKEKP